MSSSDQKSSRRRVDPATAPREELLAHLGTDPEAGLSPGEAERRLLARKVPPLYGTAVPGVGDCLKRLLRDPVLWLLLAVSVIALFFDRALLGLVCLLLTVGHTALCVYLDRRAACIDAAMQRLDAPLSRVLRGRRILRVGEAGIVRGDILLLYPGDMVPADCRLLSTRNFAVAEREMDATDPNRPAIYLEKDADAEPRPDLRAGRLSPPNMAYAGGTVERGYALAVVVATGARTHLGGLCSSVAPAHARRTPALFAAAGKYLSFYNLLCVAFIIPAVVLGIFTLKDTHEFLDIFLSVVALVGVTLGEHLLARVRFSAAFCRRDAAVDRHTADAVDIKSSIEPEKLLAMTDLLLVGTAALHDGGAHPETLIVGENTYRFDNPDADEEAAAAAELLYIYHYITSSVTRSADPADRTPLCAAIDALVPAVSDWAGIDTEALPVKLREIRVEGDTASGIIPTCDGNRRLAIRVADRFDPALEGADAYRAPYEDALRSGFRPLFLIADGRVAALLTYTPGVSPKTVGHIRALEEAGVRVRAFLRTDTAEDIRVLHACGLVPDETAFLCRTEADILRAIRDRREEGGTVAVLSVEHRDIPLLHAADIAITVSPSFFATAEENFPHRDYELTATPDASVPTPADPDGTPDAAMASDLSRRRADILVRRTTAEGGGVGGVRRALLTADRIKAAMDRTFGFILLSQAARLAFTLLAVLFGLTPLSAPIFLFSGLCVDTFAVLMLARLPGGDLPAPRRRMEDGIIPPWHTWRARLIAIALASLLPWLIAHVAEVMGAAPDGDLATYGLLCLMVLQLTLFRTCLGKAERRGRTAFLATLALALACIGSLAVALGAGLSAIWALLLPLIPGLAYLLFSWLFERLFEHLSDRRTDA